MRNKLFVQVFMIFILSVSVSFAHEDHEDDETKADTVTVVNGDTIAVNGVAVSDSRLATQEATHDEDEQIESTEEYKLNIGDALFEHIHNKIIHFPIVLAVFAFLFAILGYKDDRYQLVIKILLLIAGVFAIVAFFSGTNQFDPFIGDPKEWLANIHRLFGIASAVSIWLWYLCLIIKPLKKFSWFFAVVTVVLISVTGMYGGVLAH